jgi:hypothetical protein
MAQQAVEEARMVLPGMQALFGISAYCGLQQSL